MKIRRTKLEPGADINEQENVINDSARGGASVISSARNKTCKFCRTVQTAENDQSCACRGSAAGHKKLATLRNYMELLRNSSQLSRTPMQALNVKYTTQRRTSQDFLPMIKEPKK